MLKSYEHPIQEHEEFQIQMMKLSQLQQIRLFYFGIDTESHHLSEPETMFPQKTPTKDN